MEHKEDKKHNKGGRPKKGATEKLTYRVAVKLAAADYFRLMTRAYEAGVSSSEYMRECFRNGHVKGRLSKEHAAHVRNLCGMANNLNQLAHRANAGGFYEERDDCKVVVARIHELFQDRDMMAKIVHGSNFKGVVDYILDQNKGVQLVAHEGLFMENKDTITMSFNIQSQMNGKVAKPVGHIALSFSKEDEPRLTNHVMAHIALEYMEKMGLRNTQFFIARHFDKEHPHVHIAFNRIGNDGRTISDRNERLRSTRICKEFTLKYGLHMADGKDNIKRNRLKEPDRTKYKLYDILKTEVGRCDNWNVLVANLRRQGVEVRFKHKGQTDEVQGVVFTMNGYHFNGSKVDRRFSYSKIDAALQCNRNEARMSLMPKSYGIDIPNVISDTARGELFSGSLGLLNGNGSSCNATDTEANLEMAEILRRKKKRKKGLRL